MVPFALQARRGCSTPSDLALALAAEFAPVRPARAEAALDELAAWLAGARHDDPAAQLDALAELTAAHLEAVVLSSAIDDLLLDRVAAGGAGHPLLLAIACVEAARRAGLPVGIVAGLDGAFLAHRALADPVLVDPARGALRDARTLAGAGVVAVLPPGGGADPQSHRRARRARGPAVLGAAGRRAAPRPAVRRADARAPGGRPASRPRADELVA